MFYVENGLKLGNEELLKLIFTNMVCLVSAYKIITTNLVTNSYARIERVIGTLYSFPFHMTLHIPADKTDTFGGAERYPRHFDLDAFKLQHPMVSTATEIGNNETENKNLRTKTIYFSSKNISSMKFNIIPVDSN